MSDAIIGITVEEDVSVFPTSDYILVEISHKVGKINVPRIAMTITDLVKNDNRMVAIRGFGFKGIGLSVRIAHELKKREERFLYQMTFDTFEAADPEDGRPLTSVQIIVIPPQ
ncbi:MAG: hypothetical protein RTU92_07820 [Candidatus Thorarchaeota archaeon]